MSDETPLDIEFWCTTMQHPPRHLQAARKRGVRGIRSGRWIAALNAIQEKQFDLVFLTFDASPFRT